MGKHTKRLLFIYGVLHLASVVTFSILFLLPLIGNGRAPLYIAQCTI